MTPAVDLIDRNKPVESARPPASTDAGRPAKATPPHQRMVCKLCKRLVEVEEGVFFENARNGRLTDFQCRTCTRWELAPACGPGNIRTDLVYYD